MRERTLVFGGRGMLGRAFTAEGRRRGVPVLALPHALAEITDREVVRHWLRAFQPQWVVNCAAYTKVDDCEGNPATAFAVNELGPQLLAEEASRTGARLLHVSSDYVFPGDGCLPLTEDAETGPLSVYGESKLAGERRVLAAGDHLVVRSSWLFGPGGPNFVATIRRLLGHDEPALGVVDDQVGCPTYTVYLARALWDLARVGATGRVNYSNREPCSWYGFAREIARLCRASRGVRPITTAEFPRPARRPAYSVLDTSRFEALVGRPVEAWSCGLAEYLAGLTQAAG